MKVVAVVLCWNSREYISTCLQSLLKLELGPHQLDVVVVDNDSTDSSVDFLKSKFPSVKILRNPTNLGYAQGNNTGLRYATSSGCDFVWVINPDIILAKSCLIRFVEGAVQHTSEGIFGAKIYFRPGFETHKDKYQPHQLGKVVWYAGGIIDWGNVYSFHRGVDEVDNGQFDRDFETDFVTGACMFIKSTVLNQVGYFDPKYFLYLEENDLCQRAKRAGFKLKFLYQPTAWHANAQATGLGSSLQDYYLTRNRLLFGLRYAPAHSKLALLQESYRLIKTGRPWQKRGVLDFYAGRFGAGSYQPE